ncbi:DUF2092 domain-containing protein [Cerasicoccus arenae]|nr:DUF2092 domain-containing protein [Cerasicoccus arenae]MBK1856905.1 DUF2092 domain-containing protein [Cerasicoccus arenae]
MKIAHSTITVLALSFAFAAPVFAQDDTAPAKSPYATELITRASTFLGNQKQFCVSSEIWEDIIIDGKELEFTRTADAKVRRPDRIQIDLAMYKPTRSFYYNGKTVTMLDHRTNFYGSTEAEGNIDDTIITLDNKFDTQFPLEDLLFSKPFGNAAENATSSQYLGKVNVLGVECDHVAFQYPNLEWQAWIETGPVPVLRKVLVLRFDGDGVPRMTALFSDWDFSTPLPDFVFEFSPAAGAMEIDIVPPPMPPTETSK